MKRLLISFFRRKIIHFKLMVANGVVRHFPGFVRALVSRDQANVNQIGIVQHALSFSRDPIVTLNFFSDESGYSGSVLWAGIVKKSTNESGLLTSLFEGRSYIIDRELRLRIEIKGSLRSEFDQEICFRKLIDEYIDIIKSSDKPATLQSMLAALIVAKAPVDDIENFLISMGFSPELLTEFLKVKFLFRIEQQGEKNKYKFWEERLVSSLSKPAFIKVSLINAKIYNCGSRCFTSLESDFSSLPFKVSEKYRDEIRPLFKEIPSSKNYLGARFDLKQKAQLGEIVMNAVHAGKSLSYIRLGDGECYGFADYIYVNEQGEARQEEHWWGEQLELSLRHKLQIQFRDSVEKANIVGVPTVLRLIKDFNITMRKDYPVNSLISRIICVMKASSSYFSKKIIVEDQSNLFLFDKNFINAIFSAADKVCVVSGVKADLIERWVPDKTKLHCIEVPTHRLLRSGNLGSKTLGVLPHVYEHYLESIKAHAGQKVVFLVSAGFIGKIFIAEAAKHGSVALDIGQSLVSVVGNKKRESE